MTPGQKDGASSIYGSDAISGVVNIITRDDFEGLQANAYLGRFESENDGEIQAYDFSVGSPILLPRMVVARGPGGGTPPRHSSD